VKVIGDRDLAELLVIQTRNLNRAVSRYLKRFPDEDFMIQLIDDEFKNLMSQNGTSSWSGTRKAPYVFTEQGVTMLSGILNRERAIAVNIQIMRIFTRISQMFVTNQEIRLQSEKIKNKLDNLDKNTES
jgi:hypothetical protein